MITGAGVKDNANATEIKKKYYKMSLQLHPVTHPAPGAWLPPCLVPSTCCVEGKLLTSGNARGLLFLQDKNPDPAAKAQFQRVAQAYEVSWTHKYPKCSQHPPLDPWSAPQDVALCRLPAS